MPYSLFQKFFALPLRDKLFLPRAWLELAAVRLGLSIGTLKRLTRELDHSRAFQEQPSPPDDEVLEAQRIGYLVAVAAKFTPWQSLCLVQALAVQRLMRSKGIAGQLVIGVLPGRSRTASEGVLEAHAWLVCGYEVVSGERGHERFTVASTFSWS